MTTTDTVLAQFEGNDVMAARIEIPGAAGGLRDAMEFDAIELHLGDEVYVAIHCRTKKVRFDPESKEHPERLVRVHVLEALTAAFIDDELVGEQLRTHKLRVAKQREEAAGVQQLEDALDDDVPAIEPAVMTVAHDSGMHHGVTVAGCPRCAERNADRADDDRAARADLD